MGQLEAEEGGGGVSGDVGMGFPRPHIAEGSASVSASATSLAASPQAGLGRVGQHVLGGGGGLATTRSVGPAEYLQWLGDISSMLVHEQWRKEVGACFETHVFVYVKIVFNLRGEERLSLFINKLRSRHLVFFDTTIIPCWLVWGYSELQN